MIAKITGIPSIPFKSPQALLRYGHKYQPRAIYVDIFLKSSLTGLEVITDLKKIWPNTPLFIITGDNDPSLVESALHLGADDFIRKPLQHGEINARLWKQLEKSGHQIQYADICLYRQMNILTCGKHKQQISPIGTKILEKMMLSCGALTSRETLCECGWGKTKVAANTLNKQISSIRQSLQQVQSRLTITSVYGKGFLFKNKGEHAVQDSQRPPHRDLLIVDDNPMHLNMMVAMCKNLGLSCDTAENGKESIEKSQQQSYRIIIMDFNMPHMNGLEATQRLMHNTTNSPPIIIGAVGKLSADERKAWQQAGAVDFIDKPVYPERLAEVIDKYRLTSSPEPGSSITSPRLLKLPQDCSIQYAAIAPMLGIAQEDAKEFFLELLKVFTPAAAEMQQKLDTETSPAEMFAIAHRFRGMAENIGAKELANALDKVECHTKATQTLPPPHMCQDVHKLFLKLKQDIKMIMQWNTP